MRRSTAVLISLGLGLHAKADVALDLSSRLGGGGDEEARSIVVDAAGNVFVAGWTSSASFPLVAPLQTTCGGCPAVRDAFVVELDPTGQRVLFATYLGGSGDDRAYGLALGAAGDVYLTGSTRSTDFPVVSPLQAGLAGYDDAFVVRIDGSRTFLRYASYLGGSGSDVGQDIAESGSEAVVVGKSSSSDFPLQGPIATTPGGFVTRFTASGAALVHSTFTDLYETSSVAVDAGGAAYVGGRTSPWIVFLYGDMVLLKLSPSGALLYETTVATGWEVTGIVLDAAGGATVSGGAEDYCYHCESAPVVAKLDPAGSVVALHYLWDFGFGDFDVATGLSADAAGNAYVTGWAWEPQVPCPIVAPLGSEEDAFVLKLDAAATPVELVTLGGVRGDLGRSVAVAPSGKVWLAGWTESPDFPLRNPLQPSGNAFVARLQPLPPSPPTAAFDAAVRSGPAPFWFRPQNLSGCEVSSCLWSFGDGSTSTDFAADHTYQADGTYTVSLTVGNAAGSDTETRVGYVTVLTPPEACFGLTPRTGAAPLLVAFTDCSTGNVSSHLWEFGDGATSTAASPTHVYATPGRYSPALTVSGAAGSDRYACVSCVEAREVDPAFDARPRVGAAPLSVQFTDLSAGPVSSWLWSFGDGATSTSRDPLHVYTNTGIFDVVLTVAGATETQTLTRWSYIQAAPRKPVNIATGPGSDPSMAPLVKAFDVLGNPNGATSIIPYGSPGFGASVGAGNVDAGGFADILTGPGPSPVYGPHVRAFHVDSSPIVKVSFYAYGTLRYGVQVSAAGVDGDGTDEIVTTPGPGGVFGPHVRGFDFGSGTLVALPGFSFYSHTTTSYGCNAAGGQVAGAAPQEILVAPGPGISFGTGIVGFAYTTRIGQVPGLSFFAFPGATYGARAGAGDVDGGSREEMLAGMGPGPTLPAQVRGFMFDGTGVRALPGLDFVASYSWKYGVEPRGGDLDGDGVGEILTVPGPSPYVAAYVRGFDYNGSFTLPIGTLGFQAYPASAYGGHAATAEMGF